jgi:epoxide hydrolase
MTMKPWRIAAVAAAILVATAVMPSHAQVEAAQAAAIKPFKAHIPDGVLDNLRRRLAEAKWPDQLPGTTWEYGADVGAMRELADSWQKEYDWRAQEVRIKRFEQFTTEINGQQIHCIHQRSPRADAIPPSVAL